MKLQNCERVGRCGTKITKHRLRVARADNARDNLVLIGETYATSKSMETETGLVHTHVRTHTKSLQLPARNKDIILPPSQVAGWFLRCIYVWRLLFDTFWSFFFRWERRH